MVIGRDASREGNGPRYGGKGKIVERGLREVEGGRYALWWRGVDTAIA
ncbi:MAG: hypothetical protein OXK76_17250 [Gammaproteobacteria bacterium]|nr:hypothetical protein [Gammaproteobacteria bacterium]